MKANNGVLIAFTNGLDGNQTGVVSSSSNMPRIGTVPATGNANSYEGNDLIPVIVETHFNPGEICILSNNEFHPVSAGDNTEVPACKAVMPNVSGSTARSMKITVSGSNTTGIGAVEHLFGEGDNSQWFDLKGNRISRPTRKGVYIMNGHKVTVN